jgi:hypothetical protein
MPEIPNGSVSTLEVTLYGFTGIGFFANANDVITKINQELLYDGLTIVRTDIGFSGLSFPLTGQFSASLQILNQSGQSLEDADLVNQFTDAVSSATGGNVLSAGVTQIVGVDDGQNSHASSHGNVTTTATGAAGQTADNSSSSAVPACGDPNLSFFKFPQQWVSCLTSKGLSTVGLLAIGLLIGIILIVGLERRPTPV